MLYSDVNNRSELNFKLRSFYFWIRACTAQDWYSGARTQCVQSETCMFIILSHADRGMCQNVVAQTVKKNLSQIGYCYHT